MATCKECIHYSVCMARTHENTLCDHFKNKSDFQEVKHGMWIKKEFQGVIDIKTFETSKHFFCSICDKDNKQSMNNYCSNCGAKMDGGKNE